MNRLTRRVSAALLLAATLAVATGCGSSKDEGTSGKTSAVKKSGMSDAEREIKGLESLANEAGCTFEKVKEKEPNHVNPPKGTQGEPPVTGTHYPIWAWWGAYDSPVPDGYTVHNLEHGGVVAWYSSTLPKELRKALVEDLAQEGDKWIIAPREAQHPEAGGITAAAWTMSMNCPKAAITELGTEGTMDLLRTWYESASSRGSEAEKGLDAVVPFREDENTSKLNPPMPRPVTDTTLYG